MKFEFIENFMTETAAIKWIKENGSEIRNFKGAKCITIIPVGNRTNDYCYGHGISYYKYKTFCFSEKSYKMCLKEHRKLFNVVYMLFHIG